MVGTDHGPELGGQASWSVVVQEHGLHSGRGSLPLTCTEL